MFGEQLFVAALLVVQGGCPLSEVGGHVIFTLSQGGGASPDVRAGLLQTPQVLGELPVQGVRRTIRSRRCVARENGLRPLGDAPLEFDRSRLEHQVFAARGDAVFPADPQDQQVFRQVL